jgi:hypothetical protein
MVTILEMFAIIWGACGVAAFAAYTLRRRHGVGADWLELPVQLVASTLLGVIALIGVITNEDWRA